jgi:hypothetical protein
MGIKEIQKRLMLRLSKTSFGGLLASFENWKKLPERKDGENYRQASKFLASLVGFSRRTLKM